MTLLELGPYIRQERKRAGLSMQALSEMAGVDGTTLSKIENQHFWGQTTRHLAPSNVRGSDPIRS